MKVNVLIDSHGWIEYFSEGKLAQKYAKYVEAANSAECLTPTIVVYEVYKRVKSSKGEEAALKALAHIIAHTSVISIDQKISVYAAEISLQKKLPMADAMIKAVAELHNAKIITGDEHFKGFPDVVYID